MNQNNVSKLIIGFFMLIVGIVLIASVADSSAAITEKTNILNEAIDISSARELSNTINITASNFTIANVPTSWKVNDCPISSVVYGNATFNFTSATDYNFYTTSGIIQVLNTTTTAINSETNSTFIDYTYCKDEYLNLPWGRSIMNLVAGFFALAILGIALGIFYSVAKDENILG